MVSSPGGIALTRENRSTLSKTCHNATLSTTNLTATGLELAPTPRGDKPATNRLSHGTTVNIEINPPSRPEDVRRSEGIPSTILILGFTRCTRVTIIFVIPLCFISTSRKRFQSRMFHLILVLAIYKPHSDHTVIHTPNTLFYTCGMSLLITS